MSIETGDTDLAGAFAAPVLDTAVLIDVTAEPLRPKRKWPWTRKPKNRTKPINAPIGASKPRRRSGANGLTLHGLSGLGSKLNPKNWVASLIHTDKDDEAGDAQAQSDGLSGKDGQQRRFARARAGAPIRAIVGWVASTNQKDAIAIARDYVHAHFEAPSISWFHIERFNEGYFYEVQEGGLGRAYLPNILRALRTGKQPVYFRVRDRAFTVSINDTRPACLLQPPDQSQAFFLLTDNEVFASRTKMQPILWQGGSVLAAGVFLCISSIVFFFATTSFTNHIINSLPVPPTIAPAMLPQAQWQQLSSIPLNRYVESFRFKDGHWQQPVVQTVDKYRGKISPLDDLPQVPAGPAPATPPAAKPAPAGGPLSHAAQPGVTTRGPVSTPNQVPASALPPGGNPSGAHNPNGADLNELLSPAKKPIPAGRVPAGPGPRVPPGTAPAGGPNP